MASISQIQTIENEDEFKENEDEFKENDNELKEDKPKDITISDEDKKMIQIKYDFYKNIYDIIKKGEGKWTYDEIYNYFSINKDKYINDDEFYTQITKLMREIEVIFGEPNKKELIIPKITEITKEMIFYDLKFKENSESI